MYLVTVEDKTGCWLDDPTAWDTLAEAKKYFAAVKFKGASTVVIYECRQILDRPISEET